MMNPSPASEQSGLAIPRISVCGVRLELCKHEDLIRLAADACRTREKILVLNHNLHSLYIYRKEPAFRRAYEMASLVYIDGMPIVWLARLGGLAAGPEHRITFLDSLDTILEEAVRLDWRVFYLGSRPNVLASGLSLFGQRYPTLRIDGHSGFFAKAGPETEQVLASINRFRPDILFVGMGMPVQELWLKEFWPKINVPVVFTSGASLDYVAGAAYKPPAWAGSLGLYGLFRMVSDPRRLWRRYLQEPLALAPSFIAWVIRQRIEKQFVSPDKGTLPPVLSKPEGP